jgi:Na+-transporting methylmalonyl-CoA/oxaloacetate decarboxylase gamma subunit
MLGRILSFIFYIILAYFVWRIIKLIFNMGRTTAEFNRRMDEAKKRSSQGKKQPMDNVIELNRDQYKVK